MFFRQVYERRIVISKVFGSRHLADGFPLVRLRPVPKTEHITSVKKSGDINQGKSEGLKNTAGFQCERRGVHCGIPCWIFSRKEVSKSDLNLTRLQSWSDISLRH